MKTNWEFGPWLRAMRKAHTTLNQQDFAEAMSRSRAYVAGLENQNLRAPDRETCGLIASVLARPDTRRAEALAPPSAAEVWERAVEEKLRASDPDTYEWHRRQVASARGDQMSPAEEALIQTLRQDLSMAHAAHREIADMNARAATVYLARLGRVDPPTDAEMELIGLLRMLDYSVESGLGTRHATLERETDGPDKADDAAVLPVSAAARLAQIIDNEISGWMTTEGALQVAARLDMLGIPLEYYLNDEDGMRRWVGLHLLLEVWHGGSAEGGMAALLLPTAGTLATGRRGYAKGAWLDRLGRLSEQRHRRAHMMRDITAGFRAARRDFTNGMEIGRVRKRAIDTVQGAIQVYHQADDDAERGLLAFRMLPMLQGWSLFSDDQWPGPELVGRKDMMGEYPRWSAHHPANLPWTPVRPHLADPHGR